MNWLKFVVIFVIVLVVLDLLLFVIIGISNDLPFSWGGFLGMNAGIKDFFLDKFRG